MWGFLILSVLWWWVFTFLTIFFIVLNVCKIKSCTVSLSCRMLHEHVTLTFTYVFYITKSALLCCIISETSNKYIPVLILMTWSSAQSYCREKYTDLTSVRNQQEKEAIMSEIGYESHWWVGLSRDAWKWSDQSNSSFRVWGYNEPSNAGGKEFCTCSYGQRWADHDCDNKIPFICSGKHPHFMPTNYPIFNSKCFIFNFMLILWIYYTSMTVYTVIALCNPLLHAVLPDWVGSCLIERF